MFQFENGSTVMVRSTKKDPGGTGTVTARTFGDTLEGISAGASYRISIPNHVAQNKSRDQKGTKFQGFWYKDALITEA